MKQFIIPFFIFNLVHLTAIAQDYWWQREITFGRYLIENNFDHEALLHFQQLEKSTVLNSDQADTVYLQLGRLLYNQKHLKASSEKYNQIKKTSALYHEAYFFNFFNQAYLGEFDQAKELSVPENMDEFEEGLLNYEMAALYLLERNYPKFNHHQARFEANHFAYSQQELNLSKLYIELANRKNKSPLVAGMLSGVIPGAGRAYAGKPGQGIITLMICTLIGLQAREGYIKDGPQSVRFIAYSTAFTGMYVANIVGSVFTVKIARNEFNEAINQNILFDMHLPIHTFYRKGAK